MSNNKQSTQLTVKVYYLENGVNKEIRKFSLDEEMATNYEYLMGKIKVFFTGLLRKDIQLFWKDGDGDFILVSSDDELLELLKTVPCNTEHLKLYIKEKLADPEPTNYNHPGIICDGCDEAINGIRYICTVCPNFDLCATCESKGIHPMDHDMLCIKKPKTSSSSNPFVHVDISSGGDCWSGFGKAGCQASFQSSASPGTQTENEKKDDAPNTNPTPDANTTPQFNPMFTHPPFHHPPPPFHHPPPPFHHPPPPFRPPFNPHFGKFARFSTSFRPGHCSQTGTDGKSNIHVFKHCPAGSKSDNGAQATDNPVNNMADHIAKSVAENFTNNPEFLSGIMNPLFNTGNGQQSSAASGGNGPANTPEEVARNMAQSFASNPEFISGVMQSIFNRPPTQQSTETPSESSQSNGKDDIKIDGFVAVSMNNASVQEEQMDSESNVADGSHLKYDPAAKNYVLVEHEKENPDHRAEDEYERKLDEAIRQMEAMGFNNDNGWLKQLLVSKDLDIGKVVDALKPPQP